MATPPVKENFDRNTSSTLPHKVRAINPVSWLTFFRQGGGEREGVSGGVSYKACYKEYSKRAIRSIIGYTLD